MIVFHTRLENQSEESKEIGFVLAYEFGDAEGLMPTGTRLHIRRPHPDDLTFGDVEGARSLKLKINELWVCRVCV